MKNYFSKVLIFSSKFFGQNKHYEFPYKINDIKIVIFRIFRFSFLFFQIFIHCVKRKCKRTRLHHYSKQGIYLVIRFFSGVRKNFGHFLFSLQRTIYIWVIIRTFSDLLVNCFFFYLIIQVLHRTCIRSFSPYVYHCIRNYRSGSRTSDQT